MTTAATRPAVVLVVARTAVDASRWAKQHRVAPESYRTIVHPGQIHQAGRHPFLLHGTAQSNPHYAEILATLQRHGCTELPEY